MPQYQSFPDARGDSRTLDKLKTLRLPVMEGRSFLDVGCNEGFFCGFAQFAGATRSVGLDRSSTFISRARARFPACEFHCQGWDYLPDGPFDVILLASALHYAEDQPALLHRLVDHLSRDGVLVLELGIVSSQKPEWVKVTRNIDDRWFPSMMKLREILAPYAFKWMGPSVTQAGDPVARHVVHVSRRRPVAMLLMQPPGFGKSSLAEQVFASSGPKMISGDLQVSRIARGEIEVSPPLHTAAAEDFSPYSIDRCVQRIFERGLGRELVQTWLHEAAGANFAVDGYVPAQYHAEVRKSLVEEGYLPVVLDWERVGPALLEGREIERKGKSFDRFLRKFGAAPGVPAEPEPPSNTIGFVDRIRVDGKGRVVVRGWARTAQDTLPDMLAVRLKSGIVTLDDFEKMSRPDVQKRLGTGHDMLGFRLVLEGTGARVPADIGEQFSVAPMDGRPFPFTPAVARLLGRA